MSEIKILNLGCGTKVSANSGVENLDWSWYLKIKNSGFGGLVRILLDKERRRRLDSLPANLRPCNLMEALPYEDNSVDAVYHSHVLEHMDRDFAVTFIKENYRVLKRGGVLRVAVPDMEYLAVNYLLHLKEVRDGNVPYDDFFIGEMIEQCVRRESYGTSRKSGIRRKIENILLGDARARGETHQWMYDEAALTALVTSCGFSDAKRKKYNDSLISGWQDIALDSENGGEYKPGSLYIEAVK